MLNLPIIANIEKNKMCHEEIKERNGHARSLKVLVIFFSLISYLLIIYLMCQRLAKWTRFI